MPDSFVNEFFEKAYTQGMQALDALDMAYDTLQKYRIEHFIDGCNCEACQQADIVGPMIGSILKKYGQKFDNRPLPEKNP